MAGLVCVVGRHGEPPLPPGEFDSLVRSYQDVRGVGRVTRQSVGEYLHCALVDGTVDGEFHRDAAVWSATVGRLHGPQSSARTKLDEVDGQFACIRHDTVTGKTEIFNDPFGMQALYVAEHRDRLWVSTSSTVLARHLGLSPDPLGAALFLRTGTQFGPITHWSGIRRLGPATLFTVTDSELREAIYWRPSVDRSVRELSFGDTVDHCANEVLRTVEARLSDEPCMRADLTGGFDSRLVAAALARLGIKFTAQTNGETETADVRLAREVARAGGVEWRQQALAADWVSDVDTLRSAQAWSDGTLEVLQLAEVLTRHQQSRPRCPLVVTGGGGEHFGPYPWLQEFLRAGRSTTIEVDNLMSMRILTPIDLSVLRHDVTADVAAYCRELLRRQVADFRTELNTTQLDAFYAYKSVGHFGAYRSACEAQVRSEIPCYYRNVFTAGFSASHKYRNGHRLHRAIIGKINPAVGAVETERGGPAERMSVRNAYRFVPYYSRLGRTAIRKVRRRPARVSAAESIRSAGFRRALNSLQQEGLLDPAVMRSGDLYHPSALRALVESAGRPGFGGWSALGRVVTLELGLRGVDGAALATLTR